MFSVVTRQQKHGHRIQRPRTQLFPLTDSHPLSEAVLKECADEGRFLLGRIAMTEERIEEAINQFKLVNTPSANLDLGKVGSQLLFYVLQRFIIVEVDGLCVSFYYHPGYIKWNIQMVM